MYNEWRLEAVTANFLPSKGRITRLEKKKIRKFLVEKIKMPGTKLERREKKKNGYDDIIGKLYGLKMIFWILSRFLSRGFVLNSSLV